VDEGNFHPTDDQGLDYQADEVVVLSTPSQLKAVSHPVRIRILGILAERAATITQMAEVSDKPKGTLSYHVNLLEREGLVKVVGTRKVRAITERWYGRTAERFEIVPEGTTSPTEEGLGVRFLERIIQEARPTPFDDEVPMFAIAHTRVPTDRAREFAERVNEMAKEFKDSEESGEDVFVFLGGVFLTDRPTL
jgi:DNA-binding transcriptional ArsR family regulator